MTFSVWPSWVICFSSFALTLVNGVRTLSRSTPLFSSLYQFVSVLPEPLHKLRAELCDRCGLEAVFLWRHRCRERRDAIECQTHLNGSLPRIPYSDFGIVVQVLLRLWMRELGDELTLFFVYDLRSWHMSAMMNTESQPFLEDAFGRLSEIEYIPLFGRLFSGLSILGFMTHDENVLPR